MTSGTSIDSEWFRQRIEDRGQSLRGLARFIGKNIASISRLINGERRMQIDEARMIANFLNVEVGEVLRRAGVEGISDADDPPVAARGMVCANGDVKPEDIDLPHPVHDGVRRYLRSRLGDTNQPGVALIRALDGPLAMMDDAKVVYSTTPRTPEGLCILWREDIGTLCHVTRRRSDGTLDIIDVNGVRQIVDAPTSASRVLAILT